MMRVKILGMALLFRLVVLRAISFPRACIFMPARRVLAHVPVRARVKAMSTAIPFTKMHGCGNDYVYIDALRDGVPANSEFSQFAAWAPQISDRHQGIGSDGVIILAASQRADVRMIMYNADGSESEMCGNGIRCLAKLAHDHGHVRKNPLTVETLAGILTVTLEKNGNACYGATVSMGPARLTPASVPVVSSESGPLIRLSVTVAGKAISLIAVGMGNPHAVCFVDDPETYPVHDIGPQIERHALFPKRTNVEFVARLPDEQRDGKTIPVLRQRTWERGSGETQACGTGACATAVAAMLTGLITQREVIVRLNGGDLFIRWPHQDSDVIMSGPAVSVYAGQWQPPA
jgi:diaminopimelate epimerase